MAASTSDTVYAQGQEKGKRRTVVLKAKEGLQAYEEMLVFYAMKYLTAAYGDTLPPQTLADGARQTRWVNLGGQLVAANDMEQLIADVEQGRIAGWKELNERLDNLWQAYPQQRDAHAYHVLCTLAGTDTLDETLWQHYRAQYADILNYIEQQKKVTRDKDTVNPFRNMTYWDDDERRAVLD